MSQWAVARDRGATVSRTATPSISPFVLPTPGWPGPTTLQRSRDDPKLKPPQRTFGLGLRLGLLLTSTVAGTMAVFTGMQLVFELRAELRDREARLAESLAPLVVELRSATTRDAAQAAVDRFHASYVAQGRPYHDLALVDATGRVVVETVTDAERHGHSVLEASVPVISPGLGSRPGALLRVTEDGSGFQAARARRWWSWAAHVGGTAAAFLALLYVVIRREVTGPADRLLSGIRKMELGYWDDMPDPGGAWEIRWLGWRFHSLGQELNRTVEHLVAAQRRAYAMDQCAPDEPVAPSEATSEEPAAIVESQQPEEAAVAQLRARLERLRHADPNDAADRMLAQSTWDHGAADSERLGRPDLAAELEDAALRVLDPDGFLAISTRIDGARPILESLARAKVKQMRQALNERGVRVNEIQWRVKHPAGTWRKMRLKSLLFEQVHDLLALRIIVPAEADCYHALGVVHDLYAPIVGRFKDYVVAPKPNGYRGLHCSVRDADGSVFEIQVRSVAMHRQAETGSAAHADYRVETRIRSTSPGMSSWSRILGPRWRRRE